jgi:hypothetical protein
MEKGDFEASEKEGITSAVNTCTDNKLSIASFINQLDSLKINNIPTYSQPTHAEVPTINSYNEEMSDFTSNTEMQHEKTVPEKGRLR